MYVFKSKNVYLYLSFVDFAFCVLCMCEHIFVLTDKNSYVAGHMFFQKKKKWSSEIA